ncbi:MAG: hypothetical protein ACR2MR_06475 [Dietzia maris]
MNQTHTPAPATQLAEIQQFNTPKQGYLISNETALWIQNLQERKHIRPELDFVTGAVDVKKEASYSPTAFRLLLQGLAEIVAENQVRGWKRDLADIFHLLNTGDQTMNFDDLVPQEEIEEALAEVMPFKKKTQTIEEVLEPVREEFVAQHIADTRAEIVRRRAICADARREEDEFAFWIWELTQDKEIVTNSAGKTYNSDEWKPGDVTLKIWGRRGREFFRSLLDHEDQDVRDRFIYHRQIQERGLKAKAFLDRLGAEYGNPSDERLEKMAVRAWIGRLATLEKAVARKGLDGSTARVVFFEKDGDDYILTIVDDQGRQCFARTILAGGPQVRLHLRFICT